MRSWFSAGQLTAEVVAACSALCVLPDTLRSRHTCRKACGRLPSSKQRRQPHARATACPTSVAVPTKAPASGRQVVFPAKLSMGDDTRFLQVLLLLLLLLLA